MRHIISFLCDVGFRVTIGAKDVIVCVKLLMVVADLPASRR